MRQIIKAFHEIISDSEVRLESAKFQIEHMPKELTADQEVELYRLKELETNLRNLFDIQKRFFDGPLNELNDKVREIHHILNEHYQFLDTWTKSPDEFDVSLDAEYGKEKIIYWIARCRVRLKPLENRINNELNESMMNFYTTMQDLYKKRIDLLTKMYEANVFSCSRRSD